AAPRWRPREPAAPPDHGASGMIWMHVSELAIDRLLANEIEPVTAAAMRDHCDDCARCGALYSDAIDMQRSFAANPPPLGLPIPLRRKHPIAIVASVIAVAATFAVVLAWPRRAHDDNDDDVIRTKGTAIVG